jgi:hypothetical protein
MSIGDVNAGVGNNKVTNTVGISGEAAVKNWGISGCLII